MSVHSIHHVSAVTAQISANADYFTKTLGLRLVKKSVNQDDVSVYHLFYADAVGTPGTDMTFFDWPTLSPNVTGPGTISLTSFRIPGSSFDYWMDRLEQAGSQPDASLDELNRRRILFGDPEGQRLELVDADKYPGKATPWAGSVPAENAIRGIIGVDLNSARPDATRRVLTEILGFKQAGDYVFETEDEEHYSSIRLGGSSGRLGRVGPGGVHHVAFRVENDEELLEMQGRIEAMGLSTSGYVDRFYFHSLYFREPGGVLFEIATDGPGFASDEDPAHLGENLALPPFLEGQREEIEANLKPL